MFISHQNLYKHLIYNYINNINTLMHKYVYYKYVFIKLYVRMCIHIV